MSETEVEFIGWPFDILTIIFSEMNRTIIIVSADHFFDLTSYNASLHYNVSAQDEPGI